MSITHLTKIFLKKFFVCSIDINKPHFLHPTSNMVWFYVRYWILRLLILLSFNLEIDIYFFKITYIVVKSVICIYLNI